ncbi:hypothetical protein [Roseomonas haemaphysalidis]|uniref:Uncharacterized protein n=1 Tax=Roseomonas haemaphysalidis TaxID=2768162 RepID=A0ABS3KW22_9PROT|nr:hypothetical protein [Roseomonas haemaphysalidis]MBO1081676.1 hypothetical protein [Roseomonas haemaphysalidis]
MPHDHPGSLAPVRGPRAPDHPAALGRLSGPTGAGTAWGGSGLPRLAAATVLGDPVALVICADAGLRRRHVAAVQAF